MTYYIYPTGCRKGAVTLLQKEYDDIVIIHCLIHRLELGYKDALKLRMKKLYEKTLTLLQGLYYFYHNSSAQKNTLKRTFSALNMKTGIPPRITGTRWLGHMVRSLDNTLDNYVPLTTQLATASHQNAKAEGLYKLLTAADVVTFLIFLRVCMIMILSET